MRHKLLRVDLHCMSLNSKREKGGGEQYNAFFEDLPRAKPLALECAQLWQEPF